MVDFLASGPAWPARAYSFSRLALAQNTSKHYLGSILNLPKKLENRRGSQRNPRSPGVGGWGEPGEWKPGGAEVELVELGGARLDGEMESGRM